MLGIMRSLFALIARLWTPSPSLKALYQRQELYEKEVEAAGDKLDAAVHSLCNPMQKMAAAQKRCAAKMAAPLPDNSIETLQLQSVNDRVALKELNEELAAISREAKSAKRAVSPLSEINMSSWIAGQLEQFRDRSFRPKLFVALWGYRLVIVGLFAFVGSYSDVIWEMFSLGVPNVLIKTLGGALFGAAMARFFRNPIERVIRLQFDVFFARLSEELVEFVPKIYREAVEFEMEYIARQEAAPILKEDERHPAFRK